MTERVLVTGISGFIALQVAAALLRAGYTVRGTVRNLGRSEEVRAALARAGVDASGVEFAPADLGADAGWSEAAADCTYVQHIASPFPIRQPSNREALVAPAREGALRVINAAGAAKRIVMTSSMVAMMYRPNRPAQISVGENDWTDPNWRTLTAYIVSKTRAERAVWDTLTARGEKERLAVVNPGFVLGPALSSDINTSLEVVRMLLTGAYPAMPPVSFPIVDVRDLADLHVAAMTTPAAGGRRLIGAGETLSMQEMAHVLKREFPKYARRIPGAQLPAAMARALAILDSTVRTILPDLGTRPVADSDYVTALTGVRFRPAQEAVVASAHSLLSLQKV